MTTLVLNPVPWMEFAKRTNDRWVYSHILGRRRSMPRHSNAFNVGNGWTTSPFIIFFKVQPISWDQEAEIIRYLTIEDPSFWGSTMRPLFME